MGNRFHFPLSFGPPNLRLLAGCVVLIVYIGFLLGSNYRSQVALQGAALEKMRLDVEKNAAIISYFLAERRNDLQAVIDNRKLAAYFLNKDLGMSEEYGLKVSLFVIERQFRDLMQEKTIDGKPIYEQMLFLDENRRALVGVSSHGTAAADWADVLAAEAEGLRIFLAGSRIVMSSPYFLKGRKRGHLVAIMTTADLLQHLLPPSGESLARGYRIVAGESPAVPSRKPADPPAAYGLPEHLELPTGELFTYRATAAGASAQEMVAFKAPVKNAPLALVFYSPADALYGQLSPWQLFVATGSLALILFGGVGILLWTNTQNLLLKTRIDEADRQKGELVFHNSNLKREIELRKQVEGELRLKQQQVEIQTVELQKSMQAAEEANRAKSQFLANMSHELRTPMTVIMGSVECLKKTWTTPEREKLLEMADVSAQRLLGVIEDLLDIGKIEARKLKIDAQPFNLLDCVRQTAEMFAAPAREKGIGLLWAVDPQLPERVVGDAARLGQVLTNLLGNAVKFTRAGEVELRVMTQGGALVFTVRDTGIGISGEGICKLFRPFSQVDDSMTRSYGGTGLGLAISKELVEMMGGSIAVESRVGQGSTFTFQIPLLPVQDPASSGQTEPAEEKDVRRLHVLLVEDDPLVRNLMTLILEERGLRVTTAETGHEAVARAEGTDLIFMDLQMPELNGLDATRKIREMESAQGRRARIIALSAHVRPDDRQNCLDSGMDGFLGKPIDLQDLNRVIDTCLSM